MTTFVPITQSLACRLINERKCWEQTPDGSNQSVADTAVQALAQLMDMATNHAEGAKRDDGCEKPSHFLPELQLHAALESLWTSQVKKTKLTSFLGPRAGQLSVRDVRLGGY